MFSKQELLTVTPLFYFIFLGQRLITFNDSTLQCKDWSTIGIHLVPVAFLQQFKRFLRQEWVVDKSTIHCNFVLRWDWEIESAVSCIVNTAIGANSNFLILHIYSCTTTHWFEGHRRPDKLLKHVELSLNPISRQLLSNNDHYLNSWHQFKTSNLWPYQRRDLITSNKVDFSFLPSKI